MGIREGVVMDISDRELELIKIALKEYYEMLINQQHELTARVNHLANLNDEILSIEISPVAETIEIKSQIISDIKTLWVKLNSITPITKEEN